MTKILTRTEPWGTIYYNFETDEFNAQVRLGADPIPVSPIGVGWIIIGGCNLKCIHCYGNIEDLPRYVLSTNECMQIVDRILEANVLRVVVSGGEPMLRDDITQILNALYLNGVSVVLGTNGSFIEPSNVESLRICTRVEFSLDAATKELNNVIRPSRIKSGDAWKETLNAISLCLKSDLRVRVLTALNSLNQNQLQQIADLLAQLGVKDWAISWTMPIGRALPIYDGLCPDVNVVKAELAQAIKTHPEIRIRYSERASNFSRFYCLIYPDGQMGTEDISSGRKVFLGSLLQSPVASMWNDESFDRRLHFDKWIGDRYTTVGF